VNGDYTFAAMFILVGFITSFFSKNMMVILVIAIAISNLFKMGLSSGKFEGFEEGTEKVTEEPTNETEPSIEEDTEPSKEALNSKAKSDDKKPSKDQMKQKIIQEGQELLNLQEKIVNGFETIDPYMKKAEDLTKNIQKSAGIMQKL
jgi:hypothetical protein